MGFFSYAHGPSAEGFPLLGPAHIALLLAAALLLQFALRRTRALSERQSLAVIRAAAVLVPVLELSHALWLYATGTKALVKLLPLHLCGMQSFFIPLSAFSKHTCFKDFTYATSVLGGLFGILFPAGVAGWYPVLHFQTLQTAALHTLLLFVPLALLLTGRHRPSARRFPRVLGIFLCVALAAAAVDFGFGENYMFLRAAPEGTPLVWVFETFGQGAYLLAAFLGLAGMSFCTHLPFLPRESRNISPFTSTSHL